MDHTAEKVLIVEPEDSLREDIVAALSEAGYQVSTDYREGMKAVLAFEPDVVILGADPPQLDCCDLLSEIKGSEHTRNIRVVMLSPGGSGERKSGPTVQPVSIATTIRVPTRRRGSQAKRQIGRATPPIEARARCLDTKCDDALNAAQPERIPG